MDDVAKIINATPDLFPGKAEEASLWLFSLYTGARAITAANVLIGDMSWCQNILKVRLRVTKSNPNWGHCVSIIEDVTVPRELNLI